MAIYLKRNQPILGFRLDGIFYFDQELLCQLLCLWGPADYPHPGKYLLDLDHPNPQFQLLPPLTLCREQLRDDK